MSEDFKFDGYEQITSLADIGAIDLGEVEEFRGFESFPAGNFDFEITEGELDKTGGDDPKPLIAFMCKCINVHSVIGVEDDQIPALLEKDGHRETFFIGDLEKGLGSFKAFLTDIGYAGSSSVSEAVADAVGMKFTAKVVHSHSKKDKDKIFANLKDVEPLA